MSENNRKRQAAQEGEQAPFLTEDGEKRSQSPPNNKTVIVTGAGSGVGRAVSRLLADSDYQVILVGRTPSKLQQTAQMIGSGHIVPMDLTDPGACHDLIDDCTGQFGRIDAIANVAGDAPMLPIEKITPAIWQHCIDTNLSCVIHLTAAVWPLFKKQHRSMIVNVSSMASFDPFPGFAIYAAAKVALNMFTRSIADEGKAIGLQAVCLAPGAIETSMLRRLFDKKAIPPDKTLDPMQVAQVIYDCVTGKRDFASGETIALPSP